MDRIYDCICIYMNVYMYVKKKNIYIIQPPKISTAECPQPVTKCNIKISNLEGKRSVQGYETSSCDATCESSSHIYLVLPECQRDYDLSKICTFQKFQIFRKFKQTVKE